jgi:hypothetical protein
VCGRAVDNPAPPLDLDAVKALCDGAESDPLSELPFTEKEIANIRAIVAEVERLREEVANQAVQLSGARKADTMLAEYLVVLEKRAEAAEALVGAATLAFEQIIRWSWERDGKKYPCIVAGTQIEAWTDVRRICDEAIAAARRLAGLEPPLPPPLAVGEAIQEEK